MATRAIVLSLGDSAQPTYNDNIVLNCMVAYMEGAKVFNEETPVTVALADTMVTVASKIATAVRARATALGLTAISTNNVWLPSYTKA